MEKAYERVRANSQLRSPDWDGQADGPVKDFLERTKKFFDWKAANMPKRRQEIASTMRH